MSIKTYAPMIPARQRLAPPPANVLQRKCGCGQKKRSDDERKRTGLVQRKATGEYSETVPEIVNAALRATGAPLPDEVREQFEARFGHDFSQVRIHTNALAVQSARSVSARAYTVGRDIVFNDGEFQPGNQHGQHLLAHELTHVIQQSQMSATGSLRVGAADSTHEREADFVADRVMREAPAANGLAARSARPLTVGTAPSATLQRVGECVGKVGSACNGARCTTAAGRRGMCQWGGITFGCNCRDQSGDEPNIRRVREALPAWLFAILSAAAIAAIAACFASGACEAGIIIGAVGAGAAAIVIGILESSGVTVNRGGGSEA